MSEHGMSGPGAGQGGEGGQGMRGQGMADAGQGQGGMAQGGMPNMGGAQGMHHAQYAYPYMPHMAMGPGYPMPPLPGYPPGMGQMTNPHAGQGMARAMQEMANGGGLSSLTKLLDFDDKDFWKGALVGAAAVLLLTNDSVQRALFRGAVKGRDAVEEGVEKVKGGVDKVKRTVRAAKENSDE